jgi:hypothetical protein
MGKYETFILPDKGKILTKREVKKLVKLGEVTPITNIPSYTDADIPLKRKWKR